MRQIEKRVLIFLSTQTPAKEVYWSFEIHVGPTFFPSVNFVLSSSRTMLHISPPMHLPNR